VFARSWAYLQRYLTKIDEEARELNRKSRPVNYRVHLGHGIYASVSDGYMCVDLRRFCMPYGLQGEHNIRPTKEGLALRLEDEWSALLDLMSVIHAANLELAAAKPCCDNADHANQLGMLCCSGCNPFHLTMWNAPN